ncbi:MAG: hypothetical protein HY719_08445, partial [Planctomycetes bacterium]|nr:hypothetical protein [Planctomycetota bacterium]
RFAAWALAGERELYELLIRGLVSQAEFAARREAFFGEVDADLAFIEEKNRPSWTPEPERERLRRIAAKTFVDHHGASRPLLSDRELECLLVQKGNLTHDERAEIQSHVVHSFDILKQIPFTEDLRGIPEFASKHHEKLNGSGYPHGLRAADLPMQARILAAVDVYEALTAQDRPYKPPMSNEKAMAILWAEVNEGAMDEEVVQTIQTLIDQGEIGAHVKADDGSALDEQFRF